MNRDIIFQILSDITENKKDDLMKLSDNQNLLDFGLTSIKFIQFIVAVEDKFNIEINDSDLLFSNFETIEKIFSTLKKYFNDTSLKKVLICDCDNVLWHGVSGEENIYIDSEINKLHNILVDLYNKGVFVCLCSKNESSNIDFAFDNLDMTFKKEFVTISKINFTDKVTNIKEISKELNLSLDSFVFLDDSDYELGLINSFLPSVCTIKADYQNPSFIQSINDFFSQNIYSINRTKLYKEQKEREKEKLLFKNIHEYNKSLKSKTNFNYDDRESYKRIAEITQRTNQFNLSGTRYTEQEILNIMSSKNKNILTLSVFDKYGDMGIIGVVIYETNKDFILIHSFYLSCRAFGRNFENLMLKEIKKMGKPIYGIYNETKQNKKHKYFYENNGVKLYES